MTLAAIGGVALLGAGHRLALVAAIAVLAVAAGAAVHDGAAPAAAPLLGAGLLSAAAMGERALLLGGDGEVEVEALVAWLAGVGTLAAAGMAAGALVLVASQSASRGAVIGLAAAALLAVVPAALARRRADRPRSSGDAG